MKIDWVTVSENPSRDRPKNIQYGRQLPKRLIEKRKKLYQTISFFDSHMMTYEFLVKNA